jgi:plastocyanin
MRRRFAVMLAILATVASWSTLVRSLAAASRDGAWGESARDSTVAIRTFQFAPDTVRVRAGTRVVWTNTDQIEHTITSGSLNAPDGHFNGLVAKQGVTFSALFEKAGTYRYFCDRHRFMTGTIIVIS